MLLIDVTFSIGSLPYQQSPHLSGASGLRKGSDGVHGMLQHLSLVPVSAENIFPAAAVS